MEWPAHLPLIRGGGVSLGLFYLVGNFLIKDKFVPKRKKGCRVMWFLTISYFEILSQGFANYLHNHRNLGGEASTRRLGIVWFWILSNLREWIWFSYFYIFYYLLALLFFHFMAFHRIWFYASIAIFSFPFHFHRF